MNLFVIIDVVVLLIKNKLISFDEFKSVKSADDAISFHICDGKPGKTVDIVEERKLISLMKYFSYFTHKARSNVKLIVIDMYSPYISLIKKCFPILILLLINSIYLTYYRHH